MSDSTTKRGTTEQAPVITEELATKFAREGEELRREYQKRLDAMWSIDKDALQTRSK